MTRIRTSDNKIGPDYVGRIMHAGRPYLIVPEGRMIVNALCGRQRAHFHYTEARLYKKRASPA